MAKKAFHLYFQQKLIKEPIMFIVARDLNLLLNIRRAKITAEAGEATVESGEATLVLRLDECRDSN